MWSKLLRANVLYAIGSLTNSAALFLLIPYLVNALTPQEYGAWSLFEIASLLVGMTMVAGMDVGVMRQYWQLPDEATRARLVGTVLVMVLLWGGLLVTGGLLLVGLGVGASMPSPQHSWLLLLLGAWAETFLGLLMVLLRMREKATWFVLISIGRMLLFLGGGIGLVAGGYGLRGLLLARLGAALLALLGAGYLCRA